MSTGTDDVLVRFGRWALAKIWFGVLVSGAWAIGQHYHWSQAFLTVAAVLGALALALASSFLPVWTRQRPSGISVADVGLRVMVWGGLIIGVIALLIGMPAIGMVAAALLLNTAARTFGDPFGPFLRRLQVTPAVRHTSRSTPPRHPASSRRPRPAARSASGPAARPASGPAARFVAGGNARPADGPTVHPAGGPIVHPAARSAEGGAASAARNAEGRLASATRPLGGRSVEARSSER
ncbi:hypothetical protein [Actinoplanes derwentensis]|uniref:Uncharacterized protein n=1 Tax=Actinoplanes derwentensis TaxID=113562 RepID=A0A1H1PJW2_9ACTN|nr:hypothetical protein [Actinoplanes derwentensis]GID84905.1 hypothetical protein Ade03nite_38290 [Actinoplanes derwentensis]SDS11393.1 hypothetical protein SAMN04489716_0041 [Actinoplanes derwentensis]